MEKIKFEDFTIIPMLDTLKRVEMSDEEYFGKQYKDYVSNSRLGNINPKQDGSPSAYKNPPRLQTQSLSLGTNVHMAVLTPEEAIFAPKLGRPTAKLGNCIDAIIKFRKKGFSIRESIIKASKEADYYQNCLNERRIKDIITKGYKYYIRSKCLFGNEIVMSDSDYDTWTNCVNSIHNNKDIMDRLHPINIWGEKLEHSYYEDAMFIDYVVLYKGRYTTLKYKMKIDHWSIDLDDHVLTLNDLKTSYKATDCFMNPNYGSFYHYHYGRQVAMYYDVLKLYCAREFGFDEQSWKHAYNIFVVCTSSEDDSRCWHISDRAVERGRKEYQELLKRVAYYEIFGYDKEVEFV